jgi:hypothetical protein
VSIYRWYHPVFYWRIERNSEWYIPVFLNCHFTAYIDMIQKIINNDKLNLKWPELIFLISMVGVLIKILTYHQLNNESGQLQ